MADDAPYYRIVPFSPPHDDDVSILPDDGNGLEISSPKIANDHSEG